MSNPREIAVRDSAKLGDQWRARGRPAKAERKINETLRLDADLPKAYRREGLGWQERINWVLCTYMAGEIK